MKDRKLTIYPNPASEKATIEFNVLNHGEATIHITDLIGKNVSTQKIRVTKGLNNAFINVSTLPSGTYIIKVISGKQTFTNKFIVK